MLTPGVVAAGQRVLTAGPAYDFNPPVTGAALYLDARSHDALAQGAALTSWSDLSGNGRHGYTNAPTYSAATFDRDTFGTWLHSWRLGTGRVISIPNFFSAFTAAEIFAVVKVDNDPPSTNTASALWEWRTSESAAFPNTAGTITDHFGRGGTITVGNPARSLALLNCYHVTARAGEWTAWLNEVQLVTTATNPVRWLAAGSPASVGRYGSGVWLQGNVGALLMYGRQLTTLERAATYAWLQAQWPGLP